MEASACPHRVQGLQAENGGQAHHTNQTSLKTCLTGNLSPGDIHLNNPIGRRCEPVPHRARCPSARQRLSRLKRRTQRGARRRERRHCSRERVVGRGWWDNNRQCDAYRPLKTIPSIHLHRVCRPPGNVERDTRSGAASRAVIVAGHKGQGAHGGAGVHSKQRVVAAASQGNLPDMQAGVEEVGCQGRGRITDQDSINPLHQKLNTQQATRDPKEMCARLAVADVAPA